ncbi:MAG: Gfo/Idh/MocA family oxidoreductase, partial [Planctomycetaceae bacterium]|nr:Gfo/Idh/MocA family oxidoreductase [Planctomycetaceae bacterium]
KLGTQAFAECWPLLNLVDAASIVVPTVLHARIAEEFLKRGIPLLIEKPLALNVKEAEHLVRLADENKTFIQVGHIERFNPAFEEIQRRPMQPKFIRAERLGPYTGRSTDIGVVLDLMIHDLDLLLTLVDAPVMFVQALGIRVFGDREDIANARLHFANGCIADVTASR